MAHNPALGYDEYELTTCAKCRQPVMARIGVWGGIRDVNGQRHACGDQGQPLQRSGLSGLQPLGARERSTLQK